MSECMANYDKPANFHFFRRHSSLLGHDIAHVGNPEVCTEGGHRFYWGLLAIRLGVKDVALEFGILRSFVLFIPCGGHGFRAILTGKIHGQELGPEKSGDSGALAQRHGRSRQGRPRLAFHVQSSGALSRRCSSMVQRTMALQTTTLGVPATLAPQWAEHFDPGFLAVPPLLAGFLTKVLELCGRSSGWLRLFAPQRHLADLCSSSTSAEDLPDLHLLRLLLQIIVCWQHVILLVDWLGNSGFGGIESFQPLTSQVAKVLGRVNYTFACLTAYLSLRSMQRALHGQRGFWRTSAVSTTWCYGAGSGKRASWASGCGSFCGCLGTSLGSRFQSLPESGTRIAERHAQLRLYAPAVPWSPLSIWCLRCGFWVCCLFMRLPTLLWNSTHRWSLFVTTCRFLRISSQWACWLQVLGLWSTSSVVSVTLHP